MLSSLAVAIGMSGGFAIGTGGGFEIGISGGFHRNTQHTTLVFNEIFFLFLVRQLKDSKVELVREHATPSRMRALSNPAGTRKRAPEGALRCALPSLMRRYRL